MGKIKILQFPIANSNGGITHYALGNWQWMDKSRFQCDFATMSKSLDFADDILATGSKIHYISCYAEENLKKFEEEFGRILEEGYDVVHLHTKQWKSLTIERLCRDYHINKIIVHSHNTGIDIENDRKRSYERNEHERIKKIFEADMATDFWACSGLAADFLFGNQIPRKAIRIMPNAIELEQYAFDQEIRDRYRKRFDLEDCFVIGHAGRFEYQKNHEFLIDTFYEISREMEHARLVLPGDGQLLEQMKEKVKYLGIEDKVLFPGARNDMNQWYQAMDVFCMPSRFEGLGIVLIEAQAAGLPCICSMAVPEEVEIADSFVRLPFDVEAWKEQILKYADKGREDNMRKLKEAGYDIHNQIKVIEHYYSGGNTPLL